MKNYSILFLLTFAFQLFSNSSYATENFKIKSLWYSESAPSEKSYFVVLENREDFYSGDKVIVFGNNDNNDLKYLYYTLFGLNFYTSTGSEFNLLSDSDFISGRVLLNNKVLKVTYKKLTGVDKYLYKKIDLTQADHLTRKVIVRTKRYLDNVRFLTNLDSLKDFKRKLISIKDRMGHILRNQNYLFLKVFPKQIEQEWSATPADQRIANASISLDGKDIISRKFKESDNWHSSDLDNMKLGTEVVSFYTSRPKGFTADFIKKASFEYVKYEIVNMRLINCGQFLRKAASYTWILNDGSSFTYRPFISCH